MMVGRMNSFGAKDKILCVVFMSFQIHSLFNKFNAHCLAAEIIKEERNAKNLLPLFGKLTFEFDQPAQLSKLKGTMIFKFIFYF